MASKIIQSHGGLVRGNKIGQLGLSFKIKTDDMRDAHWLASVPSSAGHTTQAHACDTESMQQARPLMPDAIIHSDTYSAIDGTDTHTFIMEWNAFRALYLEPIENTLKAPIIIDLRNICRSADNCKRGFTYLGLGWIRVRFC